MGFPTDAPKLKVVEDIGRPKFVLTPNTEWRATEEQFKSSSVAKAHDYVYQLVLHFGATPKLIADRFGIPQKDIEATFGETIKKARAELTMLIYADQITAALETTSAQMKQWVGKQFASQIENQSLTTQDQEGNDVEIQVKLVKVEQPKNEE